MRQLLCVAAFLLVVPQQEDYPGQGEHREPPKGWYCTQDKGDKGGHPCTCKRMCVTNDEGQVEVQEDAQCKVYCHKDHCGCPTSCAHT